MQNQKKLKIALISKSWPTDDRGGVAHAASIHAKMMSELGHNVLKIGSKSAYLNLNHELEHVVSCSGSGALYSPSYVDKSSLKSFIVEAKVDIIVCEAWQTGITEASIDVGNELQIPILMISHGVSIHRFSNGVKDIIRGLLWAPYRYWVLPRKVKKVNVLACLSIKSLSKRFYDRLLADQSNVQIIHLPNCAINIDNRYLSREKRKNQILFIGYFSEIKNQIAALHLLKMLPENYSMRFIGDCKGLYFQKFLHVLRKLNLEARVFYGNDSSVNICDELASSILLLSCSKTEAQPISIIEAMAYGTPFVAPPVGDIDSMRGGVISSTLDDVLVNIKKIVSNVDFWQFLSTQGKHEYNSKYTYELILDRLDSAIKLTLESKKLAIVEF